MRGPRRGLRRIVLNMLSERPMNGAELMQGIEELSFGFWKPSPGSIYPLLEQLTVSGLIKKRSDGKYELTDQGKSEVSGFRFRFFEPGTPPQMIQEMKSYISYFEDIGSNISQYIPELRELRDRLDKLLKQ